MLNPSSDASFYSWNRKCWLLWRSKKKWFDGSYLIFSDWIWSDNKTRRHMRRLIVYFLWLRWHSSWRVSSVLLPSLSINNKVVRAKEIIIFLDKLEMCWLSLTLQVTHHFTPETENVDFYDVAKKNDLMAAI
jgi:hypothetical protein